MLVEEKYSLTGGFYMIKKALMVIAHENFRDEEYQQPLDMLRQNGIQVTVASSESGIAIGKFGTQVTIDITLKDVDISAFHAIIYIGGSGCRKLWNDPDAHRLAINTLANNKVVAAICSAPVILARAGILKNVKATCFPDDKEHLKQEKAIYAGNIMEHDGLIITANGPDAAIVFAKEIIETLDHIV